MSIGYFVTLSAFFSLGLLTGCSVIDVRAKIDPAGGALTESFADVYDLDRKGLWYLVFVHEDGLLAAVHRHNPGIHLFLDNDAGIVFECRCSGRGEVIDVMGNSFRLSRGTVFLCDIENGNARVRQLPVPALNCDGTDPESIAKVIAEVSERADVAGFLSDEVHARLDAKWKLAGARKQFTEPFGSSK